MQRFCGDVVDYAVERNAAGDLIGPERQCFRKDGTPKKIYDEAAITEWTAEHGNGRYGAYKCDSGHWHIGNKLRRPVVNHGL